MTASPIFAQLSSSNLNRFFTAPFNSILRLNSGKRASLDKSFSKAGDCRHMIKTAKVYVRRAEEHRIMEEEAPEMLVTLPSFEVSPGLAHPLGVSEVESGINFAIFSQHASAVTLCIILPKSIHDGMIELALDPQKNRTGNIWHVCVKIILRRKNNQRKKTQNLFDTIKL